MQEAVVNQIALRSYISTLLVLRTGADFRLRCMGCGHEVMTPRFKAEKNIRTIEKANPSD